MRAQRPLSRSQSAAGNAASNTARQGIDSQNGPTVCRRLKPPHLFTSSGINSLPSITTVCLSLQVGLRTHEAPSPLRVSSWYC